MTSSARVDHFIANSRCVARRVEKYYRRPAEVIHPPVDTEFFRPRGRGPGQRLRFDRFGSRPLQDDRPGDFRVQPHRLAAQDRRRRAPNTKSCASMAGPERRISRGPRTRTIFAAFIRARGRFILPGEEDFGITALEAQACGTPVVAYGRGGARETVIDGKTGLFFYELKTSQSRGRA